jgi:dihydropyrimidinase
VHLGGGAPYDRICDTESVSATAGGVTTVIQYRRSPSSFLATFRAERRTAQRLLRVDTGFHFIVDGMKRRRYRNRRETLDPSWMAWIASAKSRATDLT